MNDKESFIAELEPIISRMRQLYSEREYKYFKDCHIWHPRRGKRDAYYSTILKGIEITKEEYLANVSDGNRKYHSAFIGDLKGDYYTYRKEKIKNGWQDILIKIVEEYES